MDDAPIPKELNRALIYKSWGAGDVFQLPAGLMKKMNISLNVYNALQKYSRAAKQMKATDMSKEDPEAWNMVTWIIKRRREGWTENGNR